MDSNYNQSNQVSALASHYYDYQEQYEQPTTDPNFDFYDFTFGPQTTQPTFPDFSFNPPQYLPSNPNLTSEIKYLNYNVSF
ncbi:hypothetical protein L596_014606 [Steinernema carpocapsae]|uniref:Uncharacterized protein n=1 Tax=Steinernema carpocapsae TaxID=34508 RepID=A0A4U5NCL7_STECR|nr:hypothetical protein L596_014606 [Steinernema carpocapsae]